MDSVSGMGGRVVIVVVEGRRVDSVRWTCSGSDSGKVQC